MMIKAARARDPLATITTTGRPPTPPARLDDQCVTVQLTNFHCTPDSIFVCRSKSLACVILNFASAPP